VEVLIDPNGLKRSGFIAGVLNYEDKNGVLRRRLEAAGIDVRRFEKKTMPSMTLGVRGEHAKLLAVDDEVAMFGGTNFDDEENHDFNYVVRGRGVHDFVHHFRAGYEATGAASEPVLAQRNAPDANGTLRVVSTGPGDRSPKAEILGAIRAAKESVWLEMYGLTDPDVMAALLDARKRLGQDNVRVMLFDNVNVPDPVAMLNSDYPNSTAMTTLAGGENPVALRILPSPRGGKVHTKSMLVDGRTAYVGSANYTPQEFRAVHNYVGIVEGEEPIAAIRAAFETDWARASDKKVRRWRVLHDSQPYNP
jgi:phosphatidylserine/phosphatidylglycerophosphate/cardiolipin synthase-like enzyme